MISDNEYKLDLRDKLESELANLEWMEDPDNGQTPEDIALVAERAHRLQQQWEAIRHDISGK